MFIAKKLRALNIKERNEKINTEQSVIILMKLFDSLVKDIKITATIIDYWT